jgi:hypothetical protein
LRRSCNECCGETLPCGMPDSDEFPPVAAHHKTPAGAFPICAISGANPNRSSHDPTFLPFRDVVTSETPPSVGCWREEEFRR